MRVGTLADGTAVVEFHDVKRDRWSSDGMTYQVIIPGGTGDVVRVSYLSSDISLDGSNAVVGVQNARRTLPGGMVYGLEWNFAERGPILPGTTVEYRLGTGTDPDSADSDNDGADDWTELYEAGTDPWNPDTDGDDLFDGDEIAWGTDPHAADTDGDGLPDAWEVANGLDPTLGVGDDGSSGDPDGDGLTNAQERQLGTDPQEPDTDGDGLDDDVELELGTDPLNADSDGDGLVDGDEIVYETNPLYKDTDGDCLWDGWEVSSGMDPMVDNATDENNQNDLAADPDGDGLNNWQEFVHGSLPYNAHTFNTTVSDRVYVQNGMSMTSPTNGIVLRISVGDSSQSTSERWGIILTDVERNERYYTVACDAFIQRVAEPITVLRCGGAIVNPCCAIIGEAVPMKVSVLPADFPDGAIKWRVVSGSGTFADGDTGRNVSFTATGSENSEAKLQIDVGDCPGRAPQFTLRETAMHEVRIYPCVISRSDHPSAVNVASISALLDEVNVIFRQVGMHFSLGSPPITIANDQFARWGLASVNVGKQIRNIMSGTDGIEVYFVPGLDGYEAKRHFQPLGTCNPYGIIVSDFVQPSTLAHEIGHACGLCDIYFRRDNMTPPSLLQGVRESWLPGDWNNGRGCRFYRPMLTQQDLIQRLLMFGEGNGTKADIPYGPVFGLSARDGLHALNVGRGVFLSLSPRSL